MIIPLRQQERKAWLQRTLTRLRASQNARRGRYGSWREWYLFGNYAWGARYNKIKPQVSLLAASIYSPRSVRFAFETGGAAALQQGPRLGAAADRLRTLWNVGGADRVFEDQTLWGLIDGCAIAKLGWREGKPEAGAVPAGAFGTWRDDLPTLEGQQALLHTFWLDEDTARDWLLKLGAPPSVAANVPLGPESPEEGTGGGLAIGGNQPIWMQGGTQPAGAAGAVSDWGSTAPDYAADNERKVEVEELWARDSRTHDWRVIQIMGRDLVISDRPNDFLPGACPFLQICPDPVPQYFWGSSLVASLIPLQAWREKRMNQLDRMFQRQARPPVVASGFGGVTDEKVAALMRRGGYISSQQANASIKLLAPAPNELSFTEIGEIDAMFSETSGLSESMQGKAEAGVRSGDQARALMSAGAGRITKAMMQVERAAAEGASLLYELARRYDPTPLVDDEGEPYTMADLPAGVPVEVAAHSASPVFAQRALDEAELLLKNGIATPEEFLDLADPPMASALKAGVRKRAAIEKAEQAAVIKATPPQDRWQLFTALLGHKARP